MPTVCVSTLHYMWALLIVQRWVMSLMLKLMQLPGTFMLLHCTTPQQPNQHTKLQYLPRQLEQIFKLTNILLICRGRWGYSEFPVSARYARTFGVETVALTGAHLLYIYIFFLNEKLTHFNIISTQLTHFYLRSIPLSSQRPALLQDSGHTSI